MQNALSLTGCPLIGLLFVGFFRATPLSWVTPGPVALRPRLAAGLPLPLIEPLAVLFIHRLVAGDAVTPVSGEFLITSLSGDAFDPECADRRDDLTGAKVEGA